VAVLHSCNQPTLRARRADEARLRPLCCSSAWGWVGAVRGRHPGLAAAAPAAEHTGVTDTRSARGPAHAALHIIWGCHPIPFGEYHVYSESIRNTGSRCAARSRGITTAREHGTPPFLGKPPAQLPSHRYRGGYGTPATVPSRRAHLAHWTTRKPAHICSQERADQHQHAHCWHSTHRVRQGRWCALPWCATNNLLTYRTVLD
jgi:hypothetical protein